MHAAHGACLPGEGVIDLGDGFVPAGRRQILGTEQPGEKAARVGLPLAFDALESGNRGVADGKAAHAITGLTGRRARFRRLGSL